MTTRGGRGWTGDKPKRFMVVGTKDTLSAGSRSGVVAPVPINTPSLRKEIHGAKEDNAAISSINRSSAGAGWGSAVGGGPGSTGNAADRQSSSGKGTGANKGGDDAFTRHFPDLRSGLEQAEKLDAVTKASTKVAPLRKPKPEPPNNQGPSLRPRAMLKPTGSAGGGSAATAAAQAAIAEAVHNRAASAPKIEERRRKSPTFAEEISGSKSRWTEHPYLQEGGVRGRGGGGRGAAGGRGSGGAWEASSAYRERSGGRGLSHDRDWKSARDSYLDKDFRKNFRQGPERSAGGGARARESNFGSGTHGAVNSGHDGQSVNVKPLTTTYVRQHGPPPRRVTPQAVVGSISSPSREEDRPATTQQPTRSSAYSASTRFDHTSEKSEPWDTLPDTPSKSRLSLSSSGQPRGSPEAPAVDSSYSHSISHAGEHGPPREDEKEQVGEQVEQETSAQYNETGGEEKTPHLKGSLGASGQDRASIGRDFEQTLKGRWKDYNHRQRSPPSVPTNTRWKEPKDEPRASRGWNGKGESHIGSGRRDKSIENDSVESRCVVAPVMVSSSSQSSSWRGTVDDGWGEDTVEQGGDAGLSTASTAEGVEQQDAVGVAVPFVENTVPLKEVEVKNRSATLAEGNSSSEDHGSVQGSLMDQKQTHQTPHASQPAVSATSWEPQLPVGTELWETTGHDCDALPSNSQGPGQTDSASSGAASQPWSDPWGPTGFGLAAGGDQTSNAMSFLGNGPSEAPKGRYLPPALRNSTPSARNRVEHRGETSSSAQDKADVSTQALVMPTISSNSTGVCSAPLFEQQAQPQQRTQDPQQQSPPQQQSLEEWQQAASRRVPQERAESPADQPLNQRQSIHQPHQVQRAQSLHLCDQPHIDRKYGPSHPTAFSFQHPDRRQHPIQEPALHQFQTDHFHMQSYHSQDQTGRASLPERLQRPPFQSDHVQHQFNQLQIQHRVPHSLHQAHQQQSPQQQQEHQQGYQQGHQPQLPPGPLGGQVAPHPRQQPQHHHQEMGRQTNQAQHLHMQQQQQQIPHPSPAFMMSSQGMGYSDPRTAPVGAGLGGLPVQITGAYSDVPQTGSYGFPSPDQHHKR